MEVSTKLAKLLFLQKSEQYMLRQISLWGSFFVEHHKLKDYQQGKHVKIRSLIDDEDTAMHCREWL